MTVQWSIIFLPVVLASFLTIHFCKEDNIKWKLCKFIGVLAATIPIIGVIQVYYASSRSRGYSVACVWQLLAGIVVYALMNGVFHLLG
ncbi:MAG TPA: hypothetical protein VGK14_04250 [Novimethylophilus sp.]|jgi:hypothetical protein|uniref:hypothetical protein n=1 Tax=Novimethylophilus sp. TaxID=2137426 RepID=UPI002F428EEE